jgi:1,4-dihydroxy-2-naphthoate octaprenyltransferase
MPMHLRTYWKHLRVPFQLSLAPIFLWGYFLASLRLTPAFVLGFAAFHFCLYTGITAFNSAYDRDEGPVGGMRAPPPVPPGLRAFALAIQALGAALAACVNLSFLAIYLLIAAMGAAYSHPRTRWKAHPAASVATVFVGQGALGFLGGWAAATGGIAAVLGERGIWGLFAAAFTTLGLYPLTQVYQIEEDAARGDRTLAVVLGPVGALRFGLLCLVLAGAAATTVMARTSTRIDTALITIAYLFILWQVARFARGYRQQRYTVISAFRTAMRLNFLISAGFLVFIALHLARWL